MNWQRIEELILEARKPLTKELEAIPCNPDRRNYYRFFYLLAKEMGAKMCMEIGIQGGQGSVHFAASGANVIAIDTQYEMKHKNVTMIKGDSCSQDTYQRVKREAINGIDIIFQDSSHHYLPSKTEWDLYRPLMNAGGIWICDDITPAFYNPNPNPNGRPEYQDPPGKGMVQYFEEIREAQKRLFPDVLHRGNTQGIILV